MGIILNPLLKVIIILLVLSKWLCMNSQKMGVVEVSGTEVKIDAFRAAQYGGLLAEKEKP